MSSLFSKDPLEGSEPSVNSPPTTPTSLHHPQTDSPSEPSTPPTLLKRCYNCFMNQLKTLAPFLVIMVYSVIGAWIFITVERESDKDERRQFRDQVMEARENLRNFIQNLTSDPESDWDWEIGNNRSLSITQAIFDFESAIGFSLSEDETIWGFFNAILYAGSIYTTIGYGNIACKTTSGRIITIFYAIVGIPLTLSVLNQLGTLLLKLMTKLTSFSGQIFCSLCGKRRKFRRSFSSSGRKGSPDDEKDVELGMMPKDGDADDEDKECIGEMKVDEHDPPVLATMITMIGWLFFCAGVFCFWEDWDYFTSFYFFFVSMSTIGFGDIVPAYPQYMAMMVGLVFIGLALVSVAVNVVQQKLEDIYMALLMKLLQEYMKRMSDGEDGASANMGVLGAWGLNKKAKFLMPLLSKGKRKLVMQRFQEEAKAQGIVLPPTLTDLDPGTGLPNILAIDKKSDPNEQLEVVQQLMEKKEQEKLTRQASVVQPPQPTQIKVSHVACQTGEPKKAETGQQTQDGFRAYQLREAGSQTDVNGTPKRVVREIQTRSSLSLLRDSGSQTLAKATINRLSQTFSSSWRLQDSASQTLVWPTPMRCAESQTHIPQTAEMSQQHGAGLSSLSSIGSQTFLERGDAFVQTQMSSLQGWRESGSQTALVTRSENSNQTKMSFFALREAESQTALEARTDSSAQTPLSETSDTSAQTRQSFYALRESQSQTNLFETREAPVQTRQSFFDIRHAQAQTSTPDSSHATIQTPMSYFEMVPSSSQTIYDAQDESLQTVMEVDETASQVEPETSDMRIQTGEGYFTLRSTESQTRLDMSERDTQTWSSCLNVMDAFVEARVGTAQAESQTNEKVNKERHVQTGSSAFAMSDHSTQASLPRPRSPLTSIGVQTGILSRVAHLGSSRGSGSQESSPSTSSVASAAAAIGTPSMAPLFRQMSLQKMPAPFKRQTTAHVIGAPFTPPPAFEERASPSRLRRVQSPVDEQLPLRKRSITSPDSHLPSVRALAHEFERLRSETPTEAPQATPAPVQVPTVKSKRTSTLPKSAIAPFEASKSKGQGTSRQK